MSNNSNPKSDDFDSREYYTRRFNAYIEYLNSINNYNIDKFLRESSITSEDASYYYLTTIKNTKIPTTKSTYDIARTLLFPDNTIRTDKYDIDYVSNQMFTEFFNTIEELTYIVNYRLDRTENKNLIKEYDQIIIPKNVLTNIKGTRVIKKGNKLRSISTFIFFIISILILIICGYGFTDSSSNIKFVSAIGFVISVLLICIGTFFAYLSITQNKTIEARADTYKITNVINFNYDSKGNIVVDAKYIVYNILAFVYILTFVIVSYKIQGNDTNLLGSLVLGMGIIFFIMIYMIPQSTTSVINSSTYLYIDSLDKLIQATKSMNKELIKKEEDEVSNYRINDNLKKLYEIKGITQIQYSESNKKDYKNIK